MLIELSASLRDAKWSFSFACICNIICVYKLVLTVSHAPVARHKHQRLKDAMLGAEHSDVSIFEEVSIPRRSEGPSRCHRLVQMPASDSTQDLDSFKTAVNLV